MHPYTAAAIIRRGSLMPLKGCIFPRFLKTPGKGRILFLKKVWERGPEQFKEGGVVVQKVHPSAPSRKRGPLGGRDGRGGDAAAKFKEFFCPLFLLFSSQTLIGRIFSEKVFSKCIMFLISF